MFAHRVRTTECAFVEADSRPEAATKAVQTFLGEEIVKYEDFADFDRVFVFPADDYQVFDLGLQPVGLSEVQCCGGNPFSEDNHSGHCPVARPKHDDDDNEPSDDE